MRNFPDGLYYRERLIKSNQINMFQDFVRAARSAINRALKLCLALPRAPDFFAFTRIFEFGLHVQAIPGVSHVVSCRELHLNQSIDRNRGSAQHPQLRAILQVNRGSYPKRLYGSGWALCRVLAIALSTISHDNSVDNEFQSRIERR